MNYQICTRCIMDTTDPDIIFDNEGVCNHCRSFDINVKTKWFPNEEGKQRLEALVNRIKQEGAKKQYDSIIGLSGGVDSSYLALMANKMGLRPLAVHIDTGWNTIYSVSNIEKIVKVLGFDLHTYVVNWAEMKDLQLAFLRSGVENQDTPQDHVIFAALYKFAIENGIKYVLSGSNYATESVLPIAWGHDAMDLKQLKAIHRLYGKSKLKTFPTVNFFQYRFYYPHIKNMQVVTPLNYLPYNRKGAINILQQEVGFQDYGNKHFESQFTKFFQGYILPNKFGYDKRRAHLSSLVLSGQLTREEALEEMISVLYDEDAFREDRAFIIKKLGLNDKIFSEILRAPNKSFRDYPSSEKIVNILKNVKNILYFYK